VANRHGGKTRTQFETDTLPRYIETQRWYAAKGTPVERVRITESVLWQRQDNVAGGIGGNSTERSRGAGYFLPLALAWEERDDERVRNLTTSAVAKIRQQASVGVMAMPSPTRCSAAHGCRHGSRPRDRHVLGKLQFRRTAAFSEIAGADFATLPVERPRGSSSNTVVNMRERSCQGLPALRSG